MQGHPIPLLVFKGIVIDLPSACNLSLPYALRQWLDVRRLALFQLPTLVRLSVIAADLSCVILFHPFRAFVVERR